MAQRGMTMKVIDFKLNLKGINELMRDNTALQKILLDNAQSIADNASGMSGEKYEADIEYRTDMRKLNWVAVATAFPGSKEAARDNLRHNTLEKAFRASGLPTHKGGR